MYLLKMETCGNNVFIKSLAKFECDTGSFAVYRWVRARSSLVSTSHSSDMIGSSKNCVSENPMTIQDLIFSSSFMTIQWWFNALEQTQIRENRWVESLCLMVEIWGNPDFFEVIVKFLVEIDLGIVQYTSNIVEVIFKSNFFPNFKSGYPLVI